MPINLSDPVVSKLLGSIVAGIIGNVLQSIAQYFRAARSSRKIKSQEDLIDALPGLMLASLFFTMLSFSIGPVVIALGIQAQILTGNANYLYVSMAGMVFLVIFIIRAVQDYEKGISRGRRAADEIRRQIEASKTVDADVDK